jgi:hypothetical protein
MMSFRAAIARGSAGALAATSVLATTAATTAVRHQSATTQGGIGYVSWPTSTVSASTPTFARGSSSIHDASRYAIRRSEFAAPDTDKIDLFTLNRHQMEPIVTGGGRPERAKKVTRAAGATELHHMWTPPSVAGINAAAFSQAKPVEDIYGFQRHSPFALKSKITTHEIKPAAAKRKAAGAAKRKTARKEVAAAPSPLFARVSEYDAWKSFGASSPTTVAATKQKTVPRAYSPKALRRKKAAVKAPTLAYGPKAIRVERTASKLGLSPEEAATHRASITNKRGLRVLRAKAEEAAARDAAVIAQRQARLDAVDPATSRAAMRDAGNAAINAATARTAKQMMGGKMPEAYSSTAYMRKQPEKYATPTWGTNVQQQPTEAATSDSARYTGGSAYDSQTPESSMMFLGGVAVIGFAVLAVLYARDYRLHHPVTGRDARYGNRYLTEGDEGALVEATAGGGAAAATTTAPRELQRQPQAIKPLKREPPAKMVAPAEDTGAWARVKHWADESADESVTKTHV